MRLSLSKRHTLEPPAPPDEVTIRRAYPDDHDALVRLAALDCSRPPAGDLLVAEVRGEVWAAIAIRGEGAAIADPFRPSAGIVRLLRLRAAQLEAATRASRDPAAAPARPLAAWRQPTG